MQSVIELDDEDLLRYIGIEESSEDESEGDMEVER